MLPLQSFSIAIHDGVRATSGTQPNEAITALDYAGPSQLTPPHGIIARRVASVSSSLSQRWEIVAAAGAHAARPSAELIHLASDGNAFLVRPAHAAQATPAASRPLRHIQSGAHA